MDRLSKTIAQIDRLNAADPNAEGGQPAALLYGQRMTDELLRLFPGAGETLQIAARGQHVERWVLARSDFPEGRAGYLDWRRQLARHHADTVCRLMANEGYSTSDCDQAGKMLRKEGLKRDDDVQALEDTICFVFLRWYFVPFAEKHSPEKIERIVQKTARKMSADARARVLDEFQLPPTLAAAFS